jgi:S1-C subfamily serine protease
MEERQKHFSRPTTERPPSLFNLTIWTIVIGVLAGLGGYLLAKNIWPVSNIDYLNLLDTENEIKITLEQPLTSLADKYQNSVAGVYKDVIVSPSIGQKVFDNSDFLGSAVVVTSDGWLMTTNQVVVDKTAKVVLVDEIYDIQEIIFDDFTGVAFIKIEANFIQPIDFQLTGSFKAGERLFTNIDLPASANHAFYTSFLNNGHYTSDQYLYTDSVDYFMHISDGLDNININSAPFFNVDGDLLGIVYNKNEEKLLIPAEYLKQAVKHLLNNTNRPVLGMYYIDMENNSGFIRKGNLIFHPTLRAVEYNSVADKAGIRAGDQVVAVNNDVISDSNTLTSIIQDYRIGDTVVLKIQRNGLEQDIEIEL